MTRLYREPRTLFAECAMLLYGDKFVADMTHTLGVAERTVQRWASGAREVPPEIWGRLIGLLYAEHERIGDTATAVVDRQARMLAERASQEKRRSEDDCTDIAGPGSSLQGNGSGGRYPAPHA